MAEESKRQGDTASLQKDEPAERDDVDIADDEEAGDSEADDTEDEEEEDEPKLKYARLTGNLGAVYRNGDATSAFMVAGDKMVSLDRSKYMPGCC